MAIKQGKTKQKRIGWGLIGSGGFAEHTFAPAIKEARGAELRAVSRVAAGGVADARGGGRGHNDLLALHGSTVGLSVRFADGLEVRIDV